MKKEKTKCYIMGDFNINLLNVENHEPSNTFLNLLYANSFVPMITKPTRITKTSFTIIDNIFTNDLSSVDGTKYGILFSDISDHFPILF